MAIILERASGMSALEFAEKHLFKPTGITVRRWERDPNGHYCGGSEMYMTARDLARFGFLSTTETGGGGLRELISDHIVPAVQGLKHRSR